MSKKLKEWVVGYVLFAIPIVALMYGEIGYNWDTLTITIGLPLFLLGIHFLVNKICGLK